MLKKLMLVTSVFVTVPVFAEIDLQKARASEGSCVLDVLELNKAKDRKKTGDEGLTNDGESFLRAIKKRAESIYKTYIGYVEETEIHVKKAEAIYGWNSLKQQRYVIGGVVSLDQNGDEDLITFYFKREYNSAASLKVVIHEEQSSTAYWICE